MEKPPNGEAIPDNKQEQELTFDQQVALATNLFKAVDDRNVFIKRQGGFDTFAEVGQHVGDMRSDYDKMENTVSITRQEFDEKVSNKKEFVKKLRIAGNDVLADLVIRMFSVPKDKK